MTMVTEKRPYVYICEGCTDARDVEFVLPRGVLRCPLCGGNAKRRQGYLEGIMTGPCDFCDESGFVYEATSRGVPFSVTNQVAVASGMECRLLQGYGIDWRRS